MTKLVPARVFSLRLALLVLALASLARAQVPHLGNHRDGVIGKPPAATDTIRVACVGDSITYGAGIEGRETNSYPAVLGQWLGGGFQIRNFGVSGATLLRKGDKPWWDEPEFQGVTAFAPHIIILKLGSNDSKPQNWRHAAEFETDLKALLDHFAELPGKPRVYLCLPVPAYETRWGINEKVLTGEIIPRLRRVAEERKLPVIDLHAALSDKPECFPDKIHPNAAGARLMAEAVGAALKGGGTQ